MQGQINMQLHLENSWIQLIITKAKYYNQKYITMLYKVEGQIWLLSCNIQTLQLAKKLDYKYHGPFIIVKYVSSYVYQLEILIGFHNIHNIFHILLLESY